jgi:AcrR family transcriptional regulator
MTQRGEATRARLIAATREVVNSVGYANATTKAIAEAAGVAEGTIYRHFPDKVALFFEAALVDNQETIQELATLPARVGTATVAENLEDALLRLAELRQEVLPLELALMSDPDMLQRRQAMQAPDPVPGVTSPPEAIIEYLNGEAKLGRLRSDIDTREVAFVLLRALFGLVLVPGGPSSASRTLQEDIGFFVKLILEGARHTG